MKLMRIITLTISLLAFTLVQAQSEYLVKANLEYDNGGYDEAAIKYKVAYKKEKEIETKAMILYRTGECYKFAHRYSEADEYFKKSITAKYHKQDPIVFFSYGESLLEQGKYDEAIVQFNKYKDNGGDGSIAARSTAEAEAAALNIEESDSRYEVALMAALCSPYYDYSPVLSSKKGDELVISSSRPASYGGDSDPITGEDFADLYVSKRDKKGKWDMPKVLNNTVNTSSHEGAASFTKKRDIMYFTRCEVSDNDRFGCDIFWAKKQGKNYATPNLIPIRAEGDDSTTVGHPFISSDSKFMLFASNMPGGFGGKDLYYITYDKRADAWGAPVNLGSEINTPENEMFPFIRADGGLYFSSNGHTGYGGLDVFKADANGEMAWSEVSNLQYPINSSSDDFSLIFEKDDDKGYFTSNRPGGKGMDDIYSFKMPPLEFMLNAVVYNAKTGEPIPGAKVVINGTDNSSFDLGADGNGGVELNDGELKEETTYTADISMDGFIAAGDQFSTVGLERSTTFAKEYFLDPILLEIAYTFPEVRYDLGKWELQVNNEVNSADSLNYLLELLQKNPNLVVQLEAHTDTRDGDEANRILSNKRAKTCKDYLISKGIAAARLESKGFGETKNLVSDAEIAAMASNEEKEAGHQKNRRTEFTILRFDYVPKGE
ncbi:MAG: OmpA family protein [Flavobacteriales bacterium]|jgi:peptidoglycan-associated lipoprotein|tara:strand:+ start:1781 stop:3760 length:1980 start_codon:yes stop_codon:yes gene_type:complete